MDAMEYMFSLAREDSSNVLEFKPECILKEDLMSLSSKFPLIPGSQRSITFCTTPLSQKLREIPLDADFDLTDPCSPPPRYNVLHDPHLKEYFQNPAMRKRLVEKGFITPSGFVKCTLLEFNMFRQWIRKLKLDQIHQEGRRQRQMEKQQWKERLAREQLLRDEELYSIVREREQKAREQKERDKRRREADRRKYIRLQEKDRKRREKHLEHLKRKKDVTESQREKNIAKKQEEKVEEEKQVKKIKIRLLVKRHSDDKQREIMLKKRRETLMEEKEKKLKESWKRRCSLSLARQEEKSKKEQAEREEHIRNVARRTSLVVQQRRKSQVYHDICLQRIRNALEKQYQEAENFLEKMREKKLKELEVWKQKHSRMRERHMQQSRRVSFAHKSSGPGHRRGSTLSSVWDLQASLKREFGIDDNVVYSGVVFAGRKPPQESKESVQLGALAEEETSHQVEESDQFGRLLSRLEEEFALREKVHDVVFSLIANAQNILDLEKRLEIAREIHDFVQSIVNAAKRNLSNRQTGDVEARTQVREYVLRVMNNATCVVDDLSAEQTRRAAQQIVSDAVTGAKEEIQRRKSLRDTSKEIVATAIDRASLKALSYHSDATGGDKDSIASAGAEDISESLSECAEDIVTVAIVSQLRHLKDDREVAAARCLAAEAVQAAKASLQQLYGTKLQLFEKEQDDTNDSLKSLDKCAKDMAAVAIISATRSLERAITKDDNRVITARSLAVNAVTTAKASLEKLYGVRVEVKKDEWDSSIDIFKSPRKSTTDVTQAVVSSTTQLLEVSHGKENHLNRAAQLLAIEAVRAASASLEDLCGIAFDSESKSEKSETNAKKIAAAAIISASGLLGKDSESSEVDLTVAAKELGSSAVNSAKASMDWFRSRNIVPDASTNAQNMLDEAAKNIAELAVDLATRSLERLAMKNERNLTSATRELVNDVMESATASLERLYGIKIEPVEKLVPSSQETSIISSSSTDSSESIKGLEEELNVAAHRLAADGIKSARASLERLYGIANEMEVNIKSTALEISKSLVDSSGNVRQQLEEQGLGIAARDLACCAIESAAQSILKLHEDKMSLQDIIGSDCRLLRAAAKVSTISARASLGELFDRGFIGGVQLEEATGYLATHALTSAETMLKKEQSNSNTADLDLEICKAASQLATHAIVSAEDSVARLVQIERPHASARFPEHGTMFWKVSTCVEGIVNGALRRLAATGYIDDLRDDTEQYEVITYDQARIADAEYGPSVQDLYHRESLALKASRVVNDVVQNAMDIVKTQSANNAFFSTKEVRSGNSQFARRRSSSVHFNEGAIFQSRRDSYAPRESDFLSAAKRPPTPRFRKRRAESVVSQEIQQLENELAIPSDRELSTQDVSSSDFVQRRASDPGPSFSCNRATTAEPEKLESDSRIYREDQGNSLTPKVSLYEAIKKREGTASCDISPCGSYVVLPQLNPSECSLIASRVESYETLWNQTKTSSSVTSLPSLSPKGSFVTGKGVEQICQSKELQNGLVPSSSRLPDISNATSIVIKGSSSAGSLKQSPEHPRRNSSLQFKKTSSKASPKTSKESAKLAPKCSSVKDLQSPRGSLGKLITSPRTSLHAQERSNQRLSKSGTKVSPKHSMNGEPSLQQSSAAKTVHSPENSLIRASLSSSEKDAFARHSVSQKKFKPSTKTSILYGRPSTEKLITAAKMADSSKNSPNNAALTSSVSAEKANLSLSTSKGKVAQSPRVSKEKVVVSTKASTESVRQSLHSSVENAAMSARSSQRKLEPSRHASTDNAASSPSVSKGKVTQSPPASTANAALSPCVSKASGVQSVRASTEKLFLSSSLSKGNVTQSPGTSNENAAFSPRVYKGNVTQSQRTSSKNEGLSPNNSKPIVTQSPRTSTESVAFPSHVSKEKVKIPQRAPPTEDAKLSPSVTKGDVARSPRVSVGKIDILSHSSEEKLPSHASAGKIAASTPESAEKALAKVIMQEDNKITSGGRAREQHASSEEAGGIVCQSSQTIVKTSPIQSSTASRSEDIITKTQPVEKTESSHSKKNLEGVPASSALKHEIAPDFTKGRFQDNEILAKSSATVQGKPFTLGASQIQVVGSEPDQPVTRKDKAGGDSHQTKQGGMCKTPKNVVPSLERIIQAKRLTPEGAEAETRPASSADVLALRKFTCPEQPQKIVSVRSDQSESVKAIESLKASVSKFPTTSHDLLEPKRSYGDEFVTLRKKPEGEDRIEEQGVSGIDGSVTSDKKGSYSKIYDASSKQQTIKGTRSVNEVKSYPACRKVSISRSVHDTVDDIVQRMLSTADEQGVTEATCPKDRCSREEMKRGSQRSIDGPRGFGTDRRPPSCKVSKTVRETVDFMLQTVSSPGKRMSPQSSGRRVCGSDVHAGYEVPRTASSVERFSRSTPSGQGISCVYGTSPSSSKVPSPKRSRLITTPSQEFMLLRATQSDSSIASLFSDKAADLKPKVSSAWLDGVTVGSADACVRSQSPKRPYSSPTPSLHKRSSGRLSERHSLDGVSIQKDSVM